MMEFRREIMRHVYLTVLPASKFKTSCLSAQFVTELDRERAAYNALLPAVLSRGTMRYPDMEALSAAMDTLYGTTVTTTVRKNGERQCVGFVASCIDDRFALGGEKLLEPMAALVGEMLLDPVTQGGHYLREYVESEKVNLIDSIRAIRNDKRDWANLRLLQEMCAAEPYGVSRLGDEETAGKITNHTLFRHGQRLLSSGRLELLYCGSAEISRVEEAVLQAFSTLPRGSAEELPPMQTFAAPEKPRFITEEMDVTQGKLAMGFRCGSDDVPAMMLANLIFGGSSNSKLFLNVREKLSLCYYASSSYARAKKILTVSSGIEPKDYDRTLEEILHQLEQVQQGQWEPWELEGAKSTALNSLRSVADSQGALENFYMSRAAVGQQETPEELMQSLEAVTPERICQAAQSIKLDTVYFLTGKETAQ